MTLLKNLPSPTAPGLSWVRGLPKEMAIELFKPFVMKELVAKGISQNIKNAKKLVDKIAPGLSWVR